MALTVADILVITPVIRIVRPVRQPLTPEAAAVRPKTDVGQRLVIIPMRPVARLTVTKPDVPAGLIPVPMVVAVQELAALLALILNRLLPPLPVVVAEHHIIQMTANLEQQPAGKKHLAQDGVIQTGEIRIWGNT